MKALTQEEVIAVLRAAKNCRDRCMMVLAYRHGMRTSEVCGLKLADVEMKNGQISIRRLNGSLKTTQPLTDHQGEPLLSEKNQPCKYLYFQTRVCSRFVRIGAFRRRALTVVLIPRQSIVAQKTCQPIRSGNGRISLRAAKQNSHARPSGIGLPIYFGFCCGVGQSDAGSPF